MGKPICNICLKPGKKAMDVGVKSLLVCVYFFINLTLVISLLACGLIYAKINEGNKGAHFRNGSVLYLNGITPHISDMILCGASWELDLIETTRRSHVKEKKPEVNLCKVRKNCLSIYHTWLKHACKNSPTHH